MTFLTLLIAISSVGQIEDGSMPIDYWRNPLRCGPNSLYAYLKIHGKPSDLDSISRRVVIEPSGASLAGLRKAATDLGVPSIVVKIDLADLRQVPLPAIAHYNNRGGHYRLLLKVDQDHITSADLTSGRIEDTSLDAFMEFWSGYLIIPKSTDTFHGPSQAIGWVILVVTSIILGRWIVGRLRKVGK